MIMCTGKADALKALAFQANWRCSGAGFGEGPGFLVPFTGAPQRTGGMGVAGMSACRKKAENCPFACTARRQAREDTAARYTQETEPSVDKGGYAFRQSVSALDAVIALGGRQPTAVLFPG